MIEDNGLTPGDRLPSERELSERLHVGRSSVREALRALELLGLIETRRGEGTYIRDFKDHQLIPLLSTFILQGDKSKRDVIETKTLIEKDCLSLVLNRQLKEDHLNRLLDEVDDDTPLDDFLVKIIQLADNYLILRIWLILKDFSDSFALHDDKLQKSDYIQFIQVLTSKDQEKVLKVYEKLKGMSNNR
ncbi:FadR/GntR family transcriptional regulator [Niallia sp. Krafla_26]|uniref:FadR/GntR family transcriptional regulator n=1 Tax=Niallia sp. Krafla_26 TaxID=3064703 RepID=UPI003D1832A5